MVYHSMLQYIHGIPQYITVYPWYTTVYPWYTTVCCSISTVHPRYTSTVYCSTSTIYYSIPRYTTVYYNKRSGILQQLCSHSCRLSFKKHRGYETEKEAVFLAYQVRNKLCRLINSSSQLSSPTPPPLFSRSVKIYSVGDTQWLGQIRGCGWLPLWLRWVSWRSCCNLVCSSV